MRARPGREPHRRPRDWKEGEADALTGLGGSNLRGGLAFLGERPTGRRVRTSAGNILLYKPRSGFLFWPVIEGAS